jgi:ketosteroid isomerase-like protein
VIEGIRRAVDAHDLDALGACFEENYRSEQPFHPDRDFFGRAQMRKNWSQIFAGVPDIRATVLRTALDGNTVWTEWELRGTRVDGAPALIAMITIAGIEHGQVAWMRLYLEPVTRGAGIDASVREQMRPGTPPSAQTGEVPVSGAVS